MHLKIHILLLSFVPFYLVAQNKTNIETSLNLGFASFQTDYGERGDFKSGVSGNTGFAAGIAMYVNFFNEDPLYSVAPSWFQRHVKLRGEVSYMTANLDHFGRWQEQTPLLKKMHGTATLINLGGVFEYHPFDIPDFIPGIKRNLSPYFGFGFMVGYSTPSIEVEGGDWKEDQSLLINAYRDEASNVDPKIVFSSVLSTGFRYNLQNSSALVIDMRWQRFNSDYIDGLNPDLDANKYKDWIFFFNVGYVFKFSGTKRTTTW